MKSQILFLLGLSRPADEGHSLMVDPKKAQTSRRIASSVTIDISKLRNNRGFGKRPGDADFDGRGSSYPAQYLPPENFTYGGVNFIFPQYQKGAGTSDNVLAQGQRLEVPRGRYVGIHMLAAAETAIATGSVNVTYADKTTVSSPMLVDPFWNWPVRECVLRGGRPTTLTVGV